jgi:hypothetical protein
LKTGEHDAAHVKEQLGFGAIARWANMRGAVAVRPFPPFLNHVHAAVRKSAVKALLALNTASARQALNRHRTRETDPDLLALIDSKP